MQPCLTRFDRYLPTDVRHVTETAEVLGVHEVEVFRLAYRWWHKSELSNTDLDKKFSAYLLEESVPPWVRHFCRKILNLDALGQLDPRSFGVDRPSVNRFTIEEQRIVALITLLGFLAYVLLLA